MRAPDTGRLDSHQYFSLAAHWPHDIHEWDNLRCASDGSFPWHEFASRTVRRSTTSGAIGTPLGAPC